MKSNDLEIRSGGQTGADRAALDWAIQNGVPHGGWCPKGRTAEVLPGSSDDIPGRIPDHYRLEETPSLDSTQRTDWNVRDSDGTVIFTIGPELRTGSRRTWNTARNSRKPLLHLAQCAHQPAAAATLLQHFMEEHQIRRLNVAGSKASEEPGIAQFVSVVLSQAFAGRSG